MAIELANATDVLAERVRPMRRKAVTDMSARGEPYLWALGGALALGIVMILGFLLLVFWNGIVTFYPAPVEVITLANGSTVAGEPTRTEQFRIPAGQVQTLTPEARARIEKDFGFGRRTLYRTGNFDFYNDDFLWVSEHDVRAIARPQGMVVAERVEWGPFVGTIKSVRIGETVIANPTPTQPDVAAAHAAARERRARILALEHDEIGAVNHTLEKERLRLRKIGLKDGFGSAAFREAEALLAQRAAVLQVEYDRLAAEAQRVKVEDGEVRIVLAEVGGREKEIPLSGIVRMYAANDLSLAQKLGVYFSRWWEFLTDAPREANTEGGVLPAIFGTFAMTLLMVIAVTPFGVITALYLREYAKQGRLVAVVRISVNNLAGVPSIVYGVFGLGFFAYVLGGTIDQLFYAERLPSPTFGTGGLLWASLTLALLTVPVVIVATEEALSAVPRSMREGSLACGASKWQTIRNIVLPRAMPGIMTGIILAMARGAGEVAPLMLVGVVKLAPELPVDGFFPFIHLERSFMHLGFHIYDVGFQSRNSEAGKPMVFVTTMLLIGLIAAMNVTAIVVRNRLKRRFVGSQF